MFIHIFEPLLKTWILFFEALFYLKKDIILTSSLVQTKLVLEANTKKVGKAAFNIFCDQAQPIPEARISVGVVWIFFQLHFCSELSLQLSILLFDFVEFIQVLKLQQLQLSVHRHFVSFDGNLLLSIIRFLLLVEKMLNKEMCHCRWPRTTSWRQLRK